MVGVGEGCGVFVVGTELICSLFSGEETTTIAGGTVAIWAMVGNSVGESKISLISAGRSSPLPENEGVGNASAWPRTPSCCNGSGRYNKYRLGTERKIVGKNKAKMAPTNRRIIPHQISGLLRFSLPSFAISV